MRKDIRILSIFIALNTLAINGTLYKLIMNNCEGESTAKLITMLVVTILISFGLAFVLQKLGFRFAVNSKEEQNQPKQ